MSSWLAVRPSSARKFCETHSGVKIHFNFCFPLALIFHLQTKSATPGKVSEKRANDSETNLTHA